MKIKPTSIKLALLCLLSIVPNYLNAAPRKTIAITIDDLPFVGEYRNFHLKMIMDTLVQQQVPATGFIIASEVRKDNWAMLHQFKDAGFGLGNHTFSHANLNRMSTKDYMLEIKKADSLLVPVLTNPKYFRYPYLAMSTGTKRDDILCYLAKKHYEVAQITVDSKDFSFNQRLLSVPELQRRDYLNELKPFYLDFIWQQTQQAERRNPSHQTAASSQILLIHANLLNAYTLGDIITLYKDQGYDFVTLQEALKTVKVTNPCKKQLAQLDTTDAPIESFVQWD
jgi:peptidoglycan/xylan/chitin deacetylase (PgdA/CDA1 family)